MGGPGDPGVFLPGALLDGLFEYGPLGLPTPDEQAIVDFKDTDTNSIDVFYVPALPDEARGGKAYRQGSNGSGDARYQNFCVLDSQPGFAAKELILAHEIMHILLNSSHRDDDPSVALFAGAGDDEPPGKPVTGRKRIGPFPNAGPGENDTFTIRANAESLPQ
jgi:hypothetical protein